MKRREFITLLGGAATSWPLAATAQQASRIYRLGFLIPSGRDAPQVLAFFDELRLAGFVEGKNLSVVGQEFSGRFDQYPELAAELVKAQVDVIVGGGDASIRAAQQATRTLPIVASTDDMVGVGWVRSLARPGGNTTGVSILAPELDGKRQDILMEIVPGARRMAALADPSVTASQHLQELRDALRRRGVELSAFSIAKSEEIVPAINEAKASGAMALNVLATPVFYVNRRVIIERAAALRLPAMYQWPEMAEEGGLSAYGPRLTQIYRQVAQLVVKVLRGAKPADIPVEQPTRFELVINLKTAKAIGHEVPAGLLLRTDKVIE